ncbi:ammonium transporter [Archaeoglobus sulfaticallidus PM70-1]|uniref:Ammonium transporter n=1 Tax=Archaeoglobus sulfaticallidus PM70-1 TaxID=387631 RepID=N0BBG4_9EURY|nr:ammonium transporter [Archaeoglobus sulfaticallidus]AGK60939.1 ammonium transporter [Archaeoglobus sulfaticallidus PM70-1]
MKRWILVMMVFFLATPAIAADPSGAETLKESPETPVDFVWTLICGFLVMFMQAGFAMLEAGFSRAKNVANVMMKNLMDFAVGTIAFFAIGFALMMGTDLGGIIGTDGWFLAGNAYDVSTIEIWFFMLVFAATAATIVSGAIAERPKFSTYIIYSVIVSAIIYPVYGHWLWGGGWLSTSDFMIKLGVGYGALDFAGSGVVHALGGYIALAGCILIGPRIGKYVNGKPKAIPGHSMAFAVIGTLILWFGWFGFNPGSTLSAHELRISVIAANTNLAAAAGAVTAMLITWKKMGKPDVGITCNGAIGGLVAITAPCAWVAPWAAVLIGVVAGFISSYGYWWLERRGIDDVVGAVPVHGFNGTWGLIALGLFADGTYGVYTTEAPIVTGLLYGNAGFFACQMISAIVNFAWAFGTGFALFYILKKTVGIRVKPEEEILGLDIAEHAAISYPNFVYSEQMPVAVKRR